MVDAEGKLQDTCNLFPIVAFALEGRLALLAGAYPGRVRHGHVIVDFKDVHNPTTFANLVADYNEARKKQGKPPLVIPLPDYTEEQLNLDALRGFTRIQWIYRS